MDMKSRIFSVLVILLVLIGGISYGTAAPKKNTTVHDIIGEPGKISCSEESPDVNRDGKCDTCKSLVSDGCYSWCLNEKYGVCIESCADDNKNKVCDEKESKCAKKDSNGNCLVNFTCLDENDDWICDGEWECIDADNNGVCDGDEGCIDINTDGKCDKCIAPEMGGCEVWCFNERNGVCIESCGDSNHNKICDESETKAELKITWDNDRYTIPMEISGVQQDIPVAIGSPETSQQPPEQVSPGGRGGGGGLIK